MIINRLKEKYIEAMAGLLDEAIDAGVSCNQILLSLSAMKEAAIRDKREAYLFDIKPLLDPCIRSEIASMNGEDVAEVVTDGDMKRVFISVDNNRIELLCGSEKDVQDFSMKMHWVKNEPPREERISG